MGNPKYNLDAIEHCRSSVSSLEGPAAAAGDGLDKDVPSAMFGELDNSKVVASAASGLTTKVIEEYEKAKSVLSGVERALDAILTTVKTVEDGNAQNLAGK